MAKGRLPADERGVSEVLGYTLIFGLILISITAVAVGGVDSLRSVRDVEQMNNAERAFEVLADNTADIYRWDAPSRATEFSVGGATLFTGTNTTIRIWDEDDGTPSRTFTITPLVFRSEQGNQIVYEAGAIFRTRRDSGRIVKTPPHKWTGGGSNVPIIVIVGTYATATQSVAGTDVIARMKTRERFVAFQGETFANASITIESERADLWKRYLDEQAGIDGQCSQGSPTTTTCNIDIPSGERPIVAVHLIEMELEQ